MSYAKPSKVTRLRLPSDSTYWVDWKDSLTYGEIKATARSVMKTSEDGSIERADSVSAADSTLLAHVTDWNLDDDQGNKLPLTVESLDVLSEEDSGFLLTHLAKTAEKQEKARKK